jgi:hypothetical protein
MSYTVKNLISTSADDCRDLIERITDIKLLSQLHAECIDIGHKTRAAHVARRLRQLGRNIR